MVDKWQSWDLKAGTPTPAPRDVRVLMCPPWCICGRGGWAATASWPVTGLCSPRPLPAWLPCCPVPETHMTRGTEWYRRLLCQGWGPQSCPFAGMHSTTPALIASLERLGLRGPWGPFQGLTRPQQDGCTQCHCGPSERLSVLGHHCPFPKHQAKPSCTPTSATQESPASHVLESQQFAAPPPHSMSILLQREGWSGGPRLVQRELSTLRRPSRPPAEMFTASNTESSPITDREPEGQGRNRAS